MNNQIFPDKFLLKNKIAVVVGGAGLIGKSLVFGLAQAGAKVYSCDINKQENLKLEIKSKKIGLNVKSIQIDINNVESIDSCIKTILKDDKKIDIWINCAYPKTDDWNKKFEKIKYQSWKKNVDMHLNGYFLCCYKIALQMKKQRDGCIINFGSIYGINAPDFSIYKGTNMTMPAAYSAIKGGIINFSRYLASYLAKYCIRVNIICPGGIFNNQHKSFVNNYEKKTPMGRMGKPEEIAGPVIFLASEAASYITGQVLIVDGGWTIW